MRCTDPRYQKQQCPNCGSRWTYFSNYEFICRDCGYRKGRREMAMQGWMPGQGGY